MNMGWRGVASITSQTLPPSGLPCPTLAATHTRAGVCGWEGEGMKRQLSWLAVNKQTMCISVIDDDYITTARTTNKFD